MNFTIRHGENYRVARLLRVLSEGERVASNVANLQSKYLATSQPRVAKFFRNQSKQERFHHGVFSFAERWITPKGTSVVGESRIFDRFERELTNSISNGDFDHSVMGLQIVLEALGDSFLDTIDARMEERNMGLDTLRRMIRFQEQAHQDFGARYFEKNCHHYQALGSQRLLSAAQTQVSIIHELVDAIDIDLEALGLDSNTYATSVEKAVEGMQFKLESPLLCG